MVAFRKIFPVLAIVALLLGTALTANAQAVVAPTVAPVCTANAGVPPIVRSEGLTELTGDLVLICTGGRPGQIFLVNFQIFLNTNITSRIVGTTIGSSQSTTSIFGNPLTSGGIGGGDVTEALLLIDEAGATEGRATPTPFCVSPSPGNNATGPFLGTGATTGQQAGATCNPATPGSTFQSGTYTVFRGQRATGTQNALVWAGVPVVAPGTAGVQRIFRFTNIRANASQVGVSDTLIPSQIVAYIAVNPPGSLAIDNPQQVVGFVQRGLRFDTTDCAGGGLGTSGVQFAQCSSQNTLRTSSAPAANATLGLLRFRENFPAAFKVQATPEQFAGTNTPGNPGSVLASESGFVRTIAAPNSQTLPSTVGLATNGTRLAVRFNNLPAGTRVIVGTRSMFGTASVVLVSTGGAGENVTAGTPELTSNVSGTLNCGDTSVPGYELTAVGGQAVAIYEIVGLTTNIGTDQAPNVVPSSPRIDVTDDVRIPFGISYTPNLTATTPTPALGTATVTGSFAPFYAATNSGAGQASSGLPIPRFVDQGQNSTIFRINQCVTNLLFPYVTNWAGFDTGIAIANTSQDPFDDPSSRAQSGNCVLNYYGRLQNGNAPTTTRETTDRVLNAGEHLTFILSGGGTNGLRGNPGFQGYIIAQCGFQYGHGFAFITDGPIGNARVAEGYLAIVLDASGLNRTGQFGESQGH